MAANAQSFALFDPSAIAAPVAGSAAEKIFSSADKAAGRPPKAADLIHVEGTLPHQGRYDESQESAGAHPLTTSPKNSNFSTPSPSAGDVICG